MGSTPQVTCPFCGKWARERSTKGDHYPIWESDCGAFGSGSAMFPDLDEVADVLLSILGLDGTVSEPSTPVGEWGMVTMSMQPYNIPRSLERLRTVLHAHGFLMRAGRWREPGHEIHAIWVRRGGLDA